MDILPQDLSWYVLEGTNFAKLDLKMIKLTHDRTIVGFSFCDVQGKGSLFRADRQLHIQGKEC